MSHEYFSELDELLSLHWIGKEVSNHIVCTVLFPLSYHLFLVHDEKYLFLIRLLRFFLDYRPLF